MEIRPINQTALSRTRRIMLLLAGVVFIYTGFLVSKWYGYLIGILLIASASFSKITIVDQGGVEMKYRAISMNYTERWDFVDISSIHYKDEDKDLRGLHLTKGPMSKQLLFSKKDADTIMAKAHIINPEILIGPID